MKKLIIATTVMAIAGMSTQSVKAGDCGWNTAGQVLAGVAVGAAVVSALNCNSGNVSVSYSYNSVPACPPPATVVYAPAPVVCAPPVVYVPAPVYYAPRPVVYATPVVAYRPAVCAPPVRYYQPQVAWGRGNGNHYGHYNGRGYGQGYGNGQQYARR